MEGIALVLFLVIGGGLYWVYKVPNEADRMYHWGIGLAILFAILVVGVVLEALGARF